MRQMFDARGRRANPQVKQVVNLGSAGCAWLESFEP